jgi:hypothetical protein
MPSVNIDNDTALDVEISVKTVAIVRFIAQRRVPGSDFADFATASGLSARAQSTYRITLTPPIIEHTDLRLIFLIDGPAGRRYDISIKLEQNESDVGEVLRLNGKIAKDGKVSSNQLDVELV